MAKKIRRTAQATGAAPSQGAPAAKVRKRRSGGRVPGQLITDFTVQLSTLSEAGIPVVKALTILEGQTRQGPFKDVLGEVTEDVAGGLPLSEGMAKHERCFDPLYSSMVRAGEAGGVLDVVLRRLADFREKAAAIRSTVRGALIYPSVILAVALVVVSAVIVFVIPRFQEIFSSFNVSLPPITQVLLDISDIFVNYWYLVFGVPVLLFLLHTTSMRKGGAYRYRVHKWMLKIPVLGGVLRTAMIAAFSRTFGTLMQAGVPHLEALEIVRDTSASEVLRAAVDDIRRVVREGEGLARPMGESGVFDDMVVNMVDVGEETGELDNMLIKVADAYEVQVDRKIDAMFKLIEPVMLIVISVLVGFIVVALFMPLLTIMSTLGGA